MNARHLSYMVRCVLGIGIRPAQCTQSHPMSYAEHMQASVRRQSAHSSHPPLPFPVPSRSTLGALQGTRLRSSKSLSRLPRQVKQSESLARHLTYMSSPSPLYAFHYYIYPPGVAVLHRDRGVHRRMPWLQAQSRNTHSYTHRCATGYARAGRCCIEAIKGVTLLRSCLEYTTCLPIKSVKQA